MAEIKSILQLKGVDLLECFYEIDPKKTGFCNIDQLKDALYSFGLIHLRPYELTALLKIYKTRRQES